MQGHSKKKKDGEFTPGSQPHCHQLEDGSSGKNKNIDGTLKVDTVVKIAFVQLLSIQALVICKQKCKH